MRSCMHVHPLVEGFTRKKRACYGSRLRQATRISSLAAACHARIHPPWTTSRPSRTPHRRSRTLVRTLLEPRSDPCEHRPTRAGLRACSLVVAPASMGMRAPGGRTQDQRWAHVAEEDQRWAHAGQRRAGRSSHGRMGRGSRTTGAAWAHGRGVGRMAAGWSLPGSRPTTPHVRMWPRGEENAATQTGMAAGS